MSSAVAGDQASIGAPEGVAGSDGGGPDGRFDKARRALVANRVFQSSVAFAAFIAVFVVYGIWLGDKFVNAGARILDIHQNTPTLLLGLAVLVGLIAGQFDLSVASMATLTAFLTIGLTVNQHWPFALVIVMCLAVGAAGGLINGLLVVRVKVNAFIATLGTGGVFLGISAVYSKGTEITPGIGSSGNLPHWFSGTGSFGSVGATVPAAVIWVALAAAFVSVFFSMRRIQISRYSQRSRDIAIGVLLAVIAILLIVVLDISSWVDRVSWTMGFLLLVALALWILLDFTTFGRYLRATGGNALAARLAGVNAGKETMKAFTLGGLIAAVAGIVLAAGQGAASPDIASGYLLPAFAAAFLSTVLLSSGRFQVWGTVLGGVFLIWVSQGLIVGGLAFTWTEIVAGLVLVAAVSLSTIFRRKA